MAVQFLAWFNRERVWGAHLPRLGRGVYQTPNRDKVDRAWMQAKVPQWDTGAGQFIKSVFLMINYVRNGHGNVTLF
jgi:hypothetical protein